MRKERRISKKYKPTLAVSTCLLVFNKNGMFRVQTATFDEQPLISGDLGNIHTFPTPSMQKTRKIDQPFLVSSAFTNNVTFRV